jgi:hypothetical protein
VANTKLLLWWLLGAVKNFLLLLKRMISCVTYMIMSLGLRWFGKLGLCPHIISFCGWRLWRSFALVIGFGSWILTLCVFSADFMMRPTIIYFSNVLGLLYFGGWQNHGFSCTRVCQPLIVQSMAFFLVETIWLAKRVEFPLVF